MRFSVTFTEEAEAEFLLLPKSIREMIQKAIKNRLEVDPLSYGKPLRYSYKGHRRLRVSYYRIIYRVEENLVKVIIVKVDKRRDVYDS
jgi:mRNA interferase RelE/StbE